MILREFLDRSLLCNGFFRFRFRFSIGNPFIGDRVDSLFELLRGLCDNRFSGSFELRLLRL